MPRLEILHHAVVYRNLEPNRVSEYVSFPVVFALPDDTLLCMCRHGSARESEDAVIKLHRSDDGGRTWRLVGAPFEPREAPSGNCLTGGFGLAPDGDVIAMLCYPRRERRDDGQPHKQFYVCRSSDGGATWSEANPIDMPLLTELGPGGNLVTLSDGTMLAAAETQGDEHGGKSCAWTSLVLRSNDGGHTWSAPRSVHRADDLHYFDFRITGLADDRVLGVYWTHDLGRNRDVNVHTAWSDDGGSTWTRPQDAGFVGQVTLACSLDDGRVVAVSNHRREPFGVRILVSDDAGRSFDERTALEIWGTTPATVRSAPLAAASQDTDRNVLEAYHHFTFGSPSLTRLSDGTIVVVYYVTEAAVTFVRCCRLRVLD